MVKYTNLNSSSSESSTGLNKFLGSQYSYTVQLPRVFLFLHKEKGRIHEPIVVGAGYGNELAFPVFLFLQGSSIVPVDLQVLPCGRPLSISVSSRTSSSRIFAPAAVIELVCVIDQSIFLTAIVGNENAVLHTDTSTKLLTYCDGLNDLIVPS